MNENKQDSKDRGKVHIVWLVDYFNEFTQYCEEELRISYFKDEDEALQYLKENIVDDWGEPFPFETLKEYRDNLHAIETIGVELT